MRADSWRARGQGSTSSHGGTAFGGALALCAVLGAVGCTKANFSGDAGGASDGGKKDAKTSDVAQPGTCAPGTVSASKGQAESCSCNAECQTGLFCADGLCCTSACGQTCKACNLPSSLGVCDFFPPGRKPDDPSVCTASTPATCGQDGTCDGNGGCRKYMEGTPCKAACDGDGITGFLTCDGNGKCSEPGSPPFCPPYTCDPATSSCTYTCTTNSQCAAGQQCVAGRCGKSINGAACQSSDDCLSTFCVGASANVLGVCCNIACSDACWSCNQTGSVGACTALPYLSLDSACKATDPTTCGNNGLCDGLGSCTLYPENTLCGPSSCSGLIENTPRTCDGKGTCRDPGLVNCSPSLCTGGACAPCKTDADCETGYQCTLQTVNGVTTGTCGKGGFGHPCADATQCESSQCVDGVCCESACAGPCLACNLPSSPGQCLNVAAGASDPRNTCKNLGPALCSTNGLCDGTGACQSYPAGTPCSSQSCVAGSYTQPGTCNASGQCTAASRTCNPYVCNGSVCYAACTDSTQCVTGNVCTASSCGLKPLGASCSLGKECGSSFCAQGVCCENACTGACMACNLATPGLCVSVPDNSSDPQGKCTSTTQTNTCGSTGKCVGGACAYVPKGQNCKASSCSGASETPGSQCDGQGTCGTPAPIDCTPFACVNNVCKNSCTVATQATDCKSPATCGANNLCGLKLPGAACSAAVQCQSGFCTEGVCCNNACSDGSSGLCKTCKGTSTSVAGTCSYVDKGGSDPESGCTKSDLSKGDCSNAGTCDGAGACQRQPNTAGCRQNSCTAGVQTLAANCNGGTQCPAVQTDKCDPFVCGLTTCLMTCKANSDCNGVTCNMTTNNCGEKLKDGSTCSIDTDCTNGHCIGGTCCHTTCTACQSCNSLGTCTNINAGGAPLTNCGTKAASGACGNNGTCDGNGNCAQNATCNASFTTCKDTNTQYDPTGKCDYSGSAPACDLVADDCGAYVCSGKACNTKCATDADCNTASGDYCMGTTCRTLIAGEACGSSRNCSGSLSCVDGVCCNAASCNSCYSCNVTGKAGSCSPVAANTTDGTCVPSCTDSTHAVGASCDGAGKCVTSATTCTGGSTCSGGACLNACSATNPCPTNYTCSSGMCKANNGQPCGPGIACAVGTCVSTGSGSICCAKPCATDVACGDKNLCLADATGSGCQSHKGDSCGNTPGCSTDGSKAYTAGTCDGNGGCTQTTTSCNPFVCSATTGKCATSCTSNAGCSGNNVCSAGGTCIAPNSEADGTACSADDECQTGHHCLGTGSGTSKVCCAVACTGTSPCGTNLCSSTGKTCQYPPTSVTCGSTTGCFDTGSVNSGGNCDGAGTCVQASTSCNPFVCSATTGTCATSCTSNAGCSGNNVCSAGGTCIAPNSEADGTACSADDECQTGHHCLGTGSGTGKVCCAVACTGTSPCGTNLCSSTGKTCQYPPTSVTCGSTTGCFDTGSVNSGGNCDGAGTCVPASTSCAGYACVGGVCKSTCSGDNDCASGHTCDITSGQCS